MFILRRISGDGIEMNRMLGTAYTLIHKTKNPKDFERAMREIDPVEPENVYAFVSNDNGSHVQALYKNQKNYIMTSDGRTFSNITE